MTVPVGGENKNEEEWIDFRFLNRTFYHGLPSVRYMKMAGGHGSGVAT